MKRRFGFFTAAGLVAVSVFLLSWGTWGHQHINHAAVFALPEEMRIFFYNHIDYITEESVVPDVRKYAISDKAEFNRHYINLEPFQRDGQSVDSLSAYTLKDVNKKFDAKTLDKNGILPWYIIEMTQKLTKAFQDKHKGDILFLAADLGHYAGDATMPLHTAENHDGQLSGQKGIHSFFESQLPEQFGEQFNFYTGDAVYIKNVRDEVWKTILNSRKLADTLLLTEKQLRNSFDTTKMYVKDAAGNIVKNIYNQPVHSYEYASAWHTALNGLVERQLRTAEALTASLWYTAWVNAGKPDLRQLDEAALTERNRKNYRKDYAAWKKGHLFGFKIDKEF